MIMFADLLNIDYLAPWFECAAVQQPRSSHSMAQLCKAAIAAAFLGV
jgi:hypothetical protein